MVKRKRILITGGGGNVGQYLADDLFKQGYAILSIYRTRKPEGKLYSVYQMDLAETELDFENVDVIIHAAARIIGNTAELVKDNVAATQRIIEFAEKKGVRKFIYLSTVSVYGMVEGELSENCRRINPEIYGVTKHIAENLVKESNIPQKIIIQLPRMLGPFVDIEHPGNSGFLAMTKRILENEDVNCYIPNVLYNNYAHVSDLASFINILIKDNANKCETILLGARDKLKMIDILKIMKEEIGSGSKIIGEKANEQPKCSTINIQRACQLGYAPQCAEAILKCFIKEMYGRK